MLNIIFKNQKKEFPLTLQQTAKLFESLAIDWSACPNFALSLINLKDPIVTAIMLYKANLPFDILQNLWRQQNANLQAQLIFHNQFLLQLDKNFELEAANNVETLAAIAARWPFIREYVPHKQWSKSARRLLINKLAASENPAVRAIWEAVNKGSGTSFLKAYVGNGVFMDDIKELQPADLILLPYLYPLTLFHIIGLINIIDNEEAKQGVIDFTLASPCPFYRLKLAESLPADNPKLKELEKDPDPSIAERASQAHRRQTVFLIKPLEPPRKLSPRKQEQNMEHSAIVNIELKTIPSPRMLAVFMNICRKKSYRTLLLEGGTANITGEVVEKYVNAQLQIEAEWNLKLYRGEIEKIVMKIGNEEIALPLQILLTIAAECLDFPGTDELGLALFSIPFSYLKAALLKNAIMQPMSLNDPTLLQKAWETGDSIIQTALMHNSTFHSNLSDAQVDEILAVNSPLMLLPLAQDLHYLFEDKSENLSQEKLLELFAACAHCRDPRVRKTLQENLDGIPDEICEKY